MTVSLNQQIEEIRREIAMRERLRAVNGDLGYTALAPCTKCGVPLSEPAYRVTTLCPECRGNFRDAPEEWDRFMRGRSVAGPSPSSAAIRDERAWPVQAPRASFDMIDNLVAVIGFTLVACILVTLWG